jgi:tripeptide aminopeptidase
MKRVFQRKPFMPSSKIALPPHDPERAERLLLDLLAIPGPSGSEGEVHEYIINRIREAGLHAGSVTHDDANHRSPFGGEVGNLVVRLEGDPTCPSRLFSAHTDTLPLCVGSRPVTEGGFVHPSRPGVGLGADDRAGVAVLLATLLRLNEWSGQKPPLIFLFSVQEEVGMMGVRHVQVDLLQRPALAFNFDGAAAKLTVGASGAYRIDVEVSGVAAHAGLRPQEGVHAVAAAAKAIAALHAAGRIGRFVIDRHEVIGNVGIFTGGTAVNMVPDLARIRAEVRCHHPDTRRAALAAYRQAFEEAARSVTDARGRTAVARVVHRLDYEAYRLGDDDPSARAAEASVRATGLVPVRVVTTGGTDANWLFAHGIPAVSLGAGQVNAHTTDERVDLEQFHRACRIAFRLATTDPTTTHCGLST